LFQSTTNQSTSSSIANDVNALVTNVALAGWDPMSVGIALPVDVKTLIKYPIGDKNFKHRCAIGAKQRNGQVGGQKYVTLLFLCCVFAANRSAPAKVHCCWLRRRPVRNNARLFSGNFRQTLKKNYTFWSEMRSCHTRIV
jgi:hypothetical protein